MDKRARRRKRKNTIREIADLVKTILLVVIAIVVVGFVYLFVTEQLGGEDDSSKISVFASVFRKGSTDETEPEQKEEGSALEETNQQPSVQEGFNTDANGNLYFIRGGEVLKDCWLDYQNGLYHIGQDGFASVDELQDGAFIYHFSAKGEVTSITTAEAAESETAGTDMPGLVKSGSLLVFLDPDTLLGRFQQIQYKKSSVSHALGEDGGAEYTLPGTMQIDTEGYVYWLPYVSDPDELESMISGSLFRRLPGSSERQFVARGVTGYRVLTGENDKTVIYYCSQSTMFKCGPESCRKDETVVGYTEDMDYALKISDDGSRLYLVTKSGYPVRKETEEFTTGGMNYSLSAEGEILSVKEQKVVTVGDYIYFTDADELYGMKRSVVVRQLGEVKEAVSSEFTGECSNLYYSSDDGFIYAEYAFMDGGSHIVRITQDGDVDLLIGGDAGADQIRICGFDEDYVYVKYVKEDSADRYDVIKKAETTPLAVAVEPVEITSEEETQAQQIYDGTGPGQIITPGQTAGPGSSSGPGSIEETTRYNGPGSSETEAVSSFGPGGAAPGQSSKGPGQ